MFLGLAIQICRAFLVYYVGACGKAGTNELHASFRSSLGFVGFLSRWVFCFFGAPRSLLVPLGNLIILLSFRFLLRSCLRAVGSSYLCIFSLHAGFDVAGRGMGSFRYPEFLRLLRRVADQ